MASAERRRTGETKRAARHDRRGRDRDLGLLEIREELHAAWLTTGLQASALDTHLSILSSHCAAWRSLAPLVDPEAIKIDFTKKLYKVFKSHIRSDLLIHFSLIKFQLPIPLHWTVFLSEKIEGKLLDSHS